MGPQTGLDNLNTLWRAICAEANGGKVCIPVIGLGQARLSQIFSAQDSIRFTIMSFMFASRREKVCDELVIVVQPQVYEKLDRLEIKSFLTSEAVMSDSGHIELPCNDNCAFCAYLDGSRPYTIYSRDRLVSILVTREQRGVSHLLVVPIRHCPTILDLSEEESVAVMQGIRHAARLIDLADHRPGIAIWQNNGVPAHQTIGHLHFHVAGTLESGGTDWGKVRELSISETQAIADKLRRTEGAS